MSVHLERMVHNRTIFPASKNFNLLPQPVSFWRGFFCPFPRPPAAAGKPRCRENMPARSAESAAGCPPREPPLLPPPHGEGLGLPPPLLFLPSRPSAGRRRQRAPHSRQRGREGASEEEGDGGPREGGKEGLSASAARRPPSPATAVGSRWGAGAGRDGDGADARGALLRCGVPLLLAGVWGEGGAEREDGREGRPFPGRPALLRRRAEGPGRPVPPAAGCPSGGGWRAARPVGPSRPASGFYFYLACEGCFGFCLACGKPGTLRKRVSAKGQRGPAYLGVIAERFAFSQFCCLTSARAHSGAWSFPYLPLLRLV